MKNTFVLHFFIMSVLLFIWGIVINSEIPLWASGVLFFAVFDVIGYHFILTKEETEKPPKSSIANITYRVVQAITQALIFIVIAHFSFIAAICFLLTWWFSLCDWMYYIILKQFYKYDNITWMWWTPFGIYNKLISKPNTYKQMMVFSYLAIIISITLMIIF